MKKKITYTEAPQSIEVSLSQAVVVKDFLPPPEKLFRKEPKIKITIALNRKSVAFFKSSAKKNHTKYQTMINEILDRYVQKYSEIKAKPRLKKKIKTP